MKSNIVNVRFSDLDYFMIKSVSSDLSVSVSDFVRTAVLKEASLYCDPVELSVAFLSKRAT